MKAALKADKLRSGVLTSCRRRRAEVLYAVGADDQALVEGRDRGTRLERHHVPPEHLARHPVLARVDDERLGDPVAVLLAFAVLEDDLVALRQLVQPVEDEAGTGPLVAEAVACEVHVPLGAAAPGEGGTWHVDHAVVQRPSAGRADDRGVVDAQGIYREGHDRPARQMEAPRLVGGINLRVRWHRPVLPGYRQDLPLLLGFRCGLRAGLRFWRRVCLGSRLGYQSRLGYRSRLSRLLDPGIHRRLGPDQGLDRGLRRGLRGDSLLGLVAEDDGHADRYGREREREGHHGHAYPQQHLPSTPSRPENPTHPLQSGSPVRYLRRPIMRLSEKTPVARSAEAPRAGRESPPVSGSVPLTIVAGTTLSLSVSPSVASAVAVFGLS